MTEPAPAAPAPVADTATPGSPAPSAPSAPAAPSTPPATPPASPAPATPPADPATPPAASDPATPPADPNAPPPTEWKIPDEFKDKPWASKIKSDADLWKALDGAQGLIGKKHVPIDPATATPEQVNAYREALRPADKAEYKFNETTSDAEREALSTMLWDRGIPAWQANEVIADYEAMQAAGVAKLYDAESYMSEMKESFGDGYEPVVASVRDALARNLSPADQALLEDTPNKYLGIIYRSVAAITAGYGIQDTGAGGNTPPGNQTPADLDGEARGLLKQIQELDGKPHTAAERQELVNKRQAIFDRKAKLGQK